jgi:hypothetical protein
MREPANGNNSERLVELLGIKPHLPSASTKRAWDFLNWIVPGGAFSLLFVNQTDPSSQIHATFAVDAYNGFNDYVCAFNGVGSRYNVLFDPNSAGHCGPLERSQGNCFDYIALGLERTSSALSLRELQDEILMDMVYPHRRPRGLPMPTALWNTTQGCAAIWRVTKPMGLSQGLDTGDVIACALENDEFFPSNQKYLQVPYTVGWPSLDQLNDGHEPAPLSMPKPFCMSSRPSEHDWYSFRWLIDNADEALAEYDN